MAIVLVFLLALLGLMLLGWRARQRRQSTLPHPPTTPGDVGALVGEFDGFYVATTVAEEPLNRIAVRGLGFRARVTTTLTETGVAIGIPGQDIFIPTADLLLADRATWTIDRVVERDGLVRVAWSLGETRVDSYFRMADPEAFLDAVTTLIPQRTGQDVS